MKERILEKLNKCTFVSGQEIALELGISRTAVFKHIKGLEKLGFDIKAVPRKGYRLARETLKLHPLVVDQHLKTKFIGRPLLHFDRVNSTINQVMLRTDKAKEGLVVIAEKQAKGRGRFERKWASPAGGIWASILLKPKCSPNEAVRLNIIVSLAIAEAIEEITGLKALIKWPNDIVVDRKKVSGVLTEMKAELDKIDYAIVSFGLNVNNSAPKQLGNIATSLKQATGNSQDRLAIFCLILEKIEKYYCQWQCVGFDGVLKSWKGRCFTIGKSVEVKGLNRIFKGKALDISDDGQLIIKTADGKKHILSAGDVTISRQ